MTDTKLDSKSRAVSRPIPNGSFAECEFCRQPVAFVPRSHELRVIANVYEDSKWKRVEQFHYKCYVDAGLPYGVPNS